MKILLDARTADIQKHGVGRYARELMERMPQIRPDWNWTIIRYGEERTETQNNVKNIYVSLPLLNYTMEQSVLSTIIEEEAPDLSHSFWFPVPEYQDCPKVLTVHDMITEKGFGDFQSDRYLLHRRWHRRCFKNADYAIVPSYYTGRDLFMYTQFSPSRILQTRHGSSESFLSVNESMIREIKDKYQLPENYIFASAHTPRAYKNSGVVHEALRILSDENKDVPPIVSTGVANPSSTEKWIQLSVLSDEELAAVLAGSKFLIYPSKAEGFGLPLLEAMSAGVPVLSSNATSLPEVGGETVLYFDPDSAKELAASIDFLLQSPETLSQLRTNGKKRSMDFCWEKCAEETIHHYEKIGKEFETEKTYSSKVDWNELNRLEAQSFRTFGTPTNSGEYCALGKHLFQSGSKNEGLSILERGIEKYPDDLNLMRELGKAYLKSSEMDNAIKLFTEMYSVAKENLFENHLRSASFHLGDLLYQKERFPEAEKYLAECLDICPDHTVAPYLLDKVRGAIEASTNEERQSANPFATFAQGKKLSKSDQKDEAEALFKELLQEEMDTKLRSEVLYCLGEMFFNDQKWETAAAYFSDCLEINRLYPGAFHNLTIAEANIQCSFNTPPTSKDPDFLRELGKCYFRKENWNFAIEAFTKMRRTALLQKEKSHLRSASFHLGNSYLQKGDNLNAVKYLEECLKYCPGHEAATDLLEKIK